MGSQVPAETWGHSGTETCGHTMQPKASSFPVALLSPEILGAGTFLGAAPRPPARSRQPQAPGAGVRGGFAAGGGQMGQLLPLVTQRTNAAELSETRR